MNAGATHTKPSTDSQRRQAARAGRTAGTATAPADSA